MPRAWGQAPDELAHKALPAYLEDPENDAIAGEARKEHDPAKTVSSGEMLRELGLES